MNPPRRIRREHGFPLEGGVWFGDEGGDPHVDLRLLPSRNQGPAHFVHQIDDGLMILGLFRGQAHHEVEFQKTPTRGKGTGSRGQDIRLLQILVNNPPNSIRTSLGGDGKTGLAHGAHKLCQLRGQGLRPEAGQAGGHPHFGMLRKKCSQQLKDACMVPG